MTKCICPRYVQPAAERPREWERQPCSVCRDRAAPRLLGGNGCHGVGGPFLPPSSLGRGGFPPPPLSHLVACLWFCSLPSLLETGSFLCNSVLPLFCALRGCVCLVDVSLHHIHLAYLPYSPTHPATHTHTGRRHRPCLPTKRAASSPRRRRRSHRNGGRTRSGADRT